MMLNTVWTRFGLCVGLVGWLVLGHLALASAQSASAGFSRIINLPPSAIGEDGLIGSNTQLNVADRGAIGFRFEAGAEGGGSTNVEVNVSGGSIGNFFDANDGSTVNISGGVIGTGFDAMPGSTVEISGGVIENGFEALVGSSVTLVGGEFLINGIAPVDPSAVTLTDADVLGGTFQDGTPFVFSPQSSDSINDVVLQTVALPAIDLTPITISTRADVAPNALRAGQTLTLEGTGELGSEPPSGPRDDRVGSFVAIDATLNIDGGSVLNGFSVLRTTVDITGGSTNGAINAYAGSEFNISGGELGLRLSTTRFNAFDGSVVNVSGGFVAIRMTAASGSTVNLSGGALSNLSSAFNGSTFNVSGGDMGDEFRALEGSTVFINGGRIGSRFEAQSGSDVTLVGGEFLVNGIAPLDPSSVTLSDFDFLSGTLEDGSIFIFSPTVGDSIDGVMLLPGTLPAIDLTPVLIADADDVSPNNLRAGQSLTLRGTGVLPEEFIAVGADMIIEGGTVDGLEVASSTIDVTAGEIQQVSLIDSTFNLEGGDVGSLNVRSGATVNQSGGTLGSIGLGENSVFNLSGGTFGANAIGIWADAGSTMNLFVSEASIDGVALDLVAGETFVVEQREFTLSGILADGSEFSFVNFPFAVGFPFAPGSTITVTIVAADPEITLGDVNQDGVVDFLDISPFIGLLSAGEFQAEADCNQDGEVNFLDISPFITILSGE